MAHDRSLTRAAALFAAVFLAFVGMHGFAAAQDAGSGDDMPDVTMPDGQDQVDMDLGGGSGDDMDGGAVVGVEPVAPDVGPPKDIRPGSYTLEARLAVDGPPLGDGVTWRIYGDTLDKTGHLPLLGTADGGIIYVRLDLGTYYIHAAYGRAGATRKVTVTQPTGGDVFVLNAGGMRLTSINGKDQVLAPNDVGFDIYAPDDAGADERYLLIPNARAGHVIALNAGTYHVVAKYGDANAVVRADIKIEPGKLTEATLFQRAARLTLKLVEQHGGEAIADTSWSVTTLDGTPIADAVGAFPSLVLEAGDYTVFAKHDDKTFPLNFTVQAGANRDVEVLAK